jgi:ribosomal-protein-alanine N-acetyltransferase
VELFGVSAVQLDTGFVLRPMREEDVPAVMRVEREAYPYPWTEGILRDCLRVGYCCWVLSGSKGILGYGVMSLAAGECHILNLCVHPHAWRRGLGRRILRRLLAIARSRNVDTAFLEVRASNQSAHTLYSAEGFCEVGMRRGYYPRAQGREDAVIMALSL